jgi:chorismate synthase
MWFDDSGNLQFSSNNNGGITGGISTGQSIIARIYIKPTSSILIPKKTIDIHGNNTEIITKGRHDPCVGIRGVPVVSAMMACVLCDMFLLNNQSSKHLLKNT